MPTVQMKRNTFPLSITQKDKEKQKTEHDKMLHIRIVFNILVKM
jgi:hypothetical protein